MRLRLIAFLPAAALVAALLLMTTSSFVSAIERSWAIDSPPAPPLIRVQRYETECESLHRELDSLVAASASCDRDPACLGSPLLCGHRLQRGLERGNQRARPLPQPLVQPLMQPLTPPLPHSAQASVLFVVCCALHDLPILIFALPGVADWCVPTRDLF